MPDIDRTALRSYEEIQAGHDRLVSELKEILVLGIRGEVYTRGQLAALRWVLGQEPAPLTGQDDVDLTNPYAIDRERLLATEMLYGRTELDRRGRAYVVGIEEALMWVRIQTDLPLCDSPA